jgi:hypothetical protein
MAEGGGPTAERGTGRSLSFLNSMSLDCRGAQLILPPSCGRFLKPNSNT